MMSESEQKRIILWAHARSVSTAFFRAMASASNTKVIFEPYQIPHYWGPDRVSKQFLEREPVPEYTYENAKATCEREYPGYKTVFIKEMAFSFREKLKDMRLFPDNYIHTFMIRDPEEAVASYYRMCTNTDKTGLKFYQPIGTKEQIRIFEMVTEILGQEPIVVDSGDLLDDPEYILQQYCHRVGIEYEDSMLHWKDLPTEVFEPQAMGFYTHVLAQKGFHTRSQMLKRVESQADIKDLPPEAMQDLEESKIIYEKLKAFKIPPKTAHKRTEGEMSH